MWNQPWCKQVPCCNLVKFGIIILIFIPRTDSCGCLFMVLRKATKSHARAVSKIAFFLHFSSTRMSALRSSDCYLETFSFVGKQTLLNPQSRGCGSPLNTRRCCAKVKENAFLSARYLCRKFSCPIAGAQGRNPMT